MYSQLADELESLKATDLYRRLRRVETETGPWATVEGRRMLMLGSNDYLGLASHPRVREAAKEAVDRWGAGAGGSRLTTGNLAIHEELEAQLAALKGSEAALLFTSGYLAATGTIPALAGRSDLILSDALNHACLIDGCRLSGAEVRIYRHGDAGHARELLADRGRFRRALVITDGVFSMDGDVAPLPHLHALSRETETWLMVDDAHATGVLGQQGGGTAEYFGLPQNDIIHMGTLSKALGSQGGFIAAPTVVVDYLRNRARSFVFDTALTPAAAGAALAALAIVREEPQRRDKLMENARLLRELLKIETQDTITPIIPVLIGEAQKALDLAETLERQGIRAPAIRPPTVPSGTARLRLSVTAARRSWM